MPMDIGKNIKDVGRRESKVKEKREVRKVALSSFLS